MDLRIILLNFLQLATVISLSPFKVITGDLGSGTYGLTVTLKVVVNVFSVSSSVFFVVYVTFTNCSPSPYGSYSLISYC